MGLAMRGVHVGQAHAARIRPTFAYGRQPPEQFVVVLTVLVLLCLTAGLVGALDIQHRRAMLAQVLDRSGPLTGAAMEIYQSLADADATAAGAFLVGDVEPPLLRERYRTNIAEASAALSFAASGAPTGDSAQTIAELTTHLPVYTGLIETARTLNRQGMPLGVSYLREASELVHTIMLPAAQRLYEQENSRLSAAQMSASRLDWRPIVVGVLALLALIAAQVHLTRTTHRIFNVGLLAATGFALAAVSWLIIVSLVGSGHSAAGRDDGTVQVEAFATARIAALQARGHESLTLVARGNGRPYEDSFTATAKRLDGADGLLAAAGKAATGPDTGAAVQRATEAWRQWLASHQKLRAEDDSGNYNTAVRLATSDDPNGTTTPSTVLDNQLSDAIQGATQRFEEESVRARDALANGEPAVAVLMVLAAFGVGVGYAPRLREFR